MLIRLVTIFIGLFVIIYSEVFVYNTENEEGIEKFDCVYYVYNDLEEISYCRRPGGSQSLDRHQQTCDNQAEKILLRDLLSRNISTKSILEWSSTSEVADLYASLLHNRSSISDNDELFLCNCTKPGTFGKYCEYQLTHEATRFSDAVNAQFQQKKNGDSWNTQRYGKVLCYETLPCESSPLCLDWREIFDGVQRCSNGIDEENWDTLEFNECEDNEYRCTNGMCIAEEFWLDGDFDCMDWSDEYLINFGQHCPYMPTSLICDEHVCLGRGLYSCGDGECVSWYIRMSFQRLAHADDDCFNKRNLNYLCEIGYHKSTWTLKDGLCWPDRDYDDPRFPSWNMIHTSNLTNDEKCQYLFQCGLSDGFEHDCPCNRENCTRLMETICRSDRLIRYPPQGLINSNVLIFYNYSQSMEKLRFLFYLHGGVRCPGYFHRTVVPILLDHTPYTITYPYINQILCVIKDDSNKSYPDFSSPYQNDKFCWNESVTFNRRPYAVNPDVCNESGECISQYRIRDGIFDCLSGGDEVEVSEKNYCTGNVGRHRFQCFNDQHKCLPPIILGATDPQCSNLYDTSWYGIGATFSLRQDIPCYKRNTADCHIIKAYIRESSSKNSTNSSSLASLQRQESVKFIPFRSYCNTFWDFDEHIDELASSCQHWVCHKDEYQCRTGQCIPIDWVCDREWDCADASDEEAIVLNQKWSNHNAHLTKLPFRLEKCRQIYSETPFSKICNTSFEFGCYRSGVPNPLNITLNHPCINLSQIGDEKEHCYNAYDEKNTFTTDTITKQMWGFHFRCGNDQMHDYITGCSSLKNCTNILCLNNENPSCSNFNDFLCPGDKHCTKGIRCNNIIDCTNGEDEYWCPTGTLRNQYRYRFIKEESLLRRLIGLSLSPIWYPSDETLDVNQNQLLSPSTNNSSNNNQSFEIYSYQCNRGVAVIQMNETRCLCPSAYYGRWCEFYSDRISIIAHFDQKNFQYISSNMTFKIRANFIFNNTTIDHHEFLIIPIFEQMKIIKHSFYLLYLRSPQMIAYKKWRYFNRTDIIDYHPYSIHFDLFALTENSTIEELGSWHYPIYFDYLPAFRLAIVLKLPCCYRNNTLNSCQEKSCPKNSTCLPIFNQNNTYYCSCRNGHYGPNCNMYEPLCETYCSANALCRVNSYDIPIKKNRFDCICPFDYFGRGCHLKYDVCHSNPCLHNGTCILNYDKSRETLFTCKCSLQFYGNRCENEKLSVYININSTSLPFALASVIQLYNYNPKDLVLDILHQRVFSSVPSIIRYYTGNTYAPMIGILKIYTDLIQPKYFLTYFLNKSIINITSSPHHCPHALSLLDIDKDVSAVFKYHKICQNRTEYLCFYDENYLCFCQFNHTHVDCFIHNPQLDHCDRCLSGGKCLQAHPNEPNEFLCLCPACHRGRQCEFSLEAFGFTLDFLLVDLSKVIKIIYTSIVCLFFIIGLFNNICSFVTFQRPAPRKFGSGNYLFIVTCYNQAALLCLFFKFIQTSFIIANVALCKIVPYLFSVFTRATFWLTSWLMIDRLLTILFPTAGPLKKPYISIGLSIGTSIVLFGMHVHEILYYTNMQHTSIDSTICVTNFQTVVISNYNRISILIHYLCPFSIQVISVTILIILAARSRAKVVVNKMTFGQVLLKQFQTQKELYITPIIIILSASPQVILTFSFACTQLSNWQRHTLLISYLISYIPQVLGFILYVMPSTMYQKEFSETLIGKKFSKWMLDKKNKKKDVVAKQKHKY